MSADELMIEEDVEKLFAFQDKRLSKETRAILLKELSESRIPTGAIILGIRKLMYEDLNSLKMGMILAACRSFVEKKEGGGSCPECSNGVVLMRDDEGREFALACRCGFGSNAQRAMGIRRWGGEPSQMANGRMLHRDNVAKNSRSLHVHD